MKIIIITNNVYVHPSKSREGNAIINKRSLDRGDLGLCLQGHTKWVGDFSTIVGVY
jgi:hypothetical protein